MRIQSFATGSSKLKFAEIEVIGRTYAETLSINNTIEKSVVKVYPNPTNGLVNINFNKTYSNVKIDVLNILGQIISTKSYETLNIATVDLGQDPGIYLVKITDNKTLNITKKIIKQ